MIQTETFYINGREFTRTYSDSNRYVVRDGISYGEACDPAEFGRTYTEGDLIEGNTIKADKTNTEIIFNKVSDIKKRRLSLSTSNRITSLLHMNSSKMVVRKPSKKLSTELTLSNIIDPSINFNMNYQLKETALKLFKTGFEEDQTKIKFFCNYLFQLKPFNKIFSKFSKSRDTNDQNKL